MFDALVAAVRAQGVETQTGVFGADMAVSLVNDGPVTVLVDSRKPASAAPPPPPAPPSNA